MASCPGAKQIILTSFETLRDKTFKQILLQTNALGLAQLDPSSPEDSSHTYAGILSFRRSSACGNIIACKGQGLKGWEGMGC